MSGRSSWSSQRISLRCSLICLVSCAALVLATTPPGSMTKDRPGFSVMIDPSLPEAIDLHLAWTAADRGIEEIHRQSGVIQAPAERAACLQAVMNASRIIATDPGTAALFAGREEIFLLLIAQGIAESGADPRAVSPQGDLGWGQINFTMLAVLRVHDPFDVAENAAGQARHMRALLKNLGARWHATKSAEEIVRLALAAYNASSRAVRNGKVPPGGRVEAYVEKVMRIYTALRAESALSQPGRCKDSVSMPAGLVKFITHAPGASRPIVSAGAWR